VNPEPQDKIDRAIYYWLDLEIANPSQIQKNSNTKPPHTKIPYTIELRKTDTLNNHKHDALEKSLISLRGSVPILLPKSEFPRSELPKRLKLILPAVDLVDD
jgi:hypothetical protein